MQLKVTVDKRVIYNEKTIGLIVEIGRDLIVGKATREFAFELINGKQILKDSNFYSIRRRVKKFDYNNLMNEVKSD